MKTVIFKNRSQCSTGFYKTNAGLQGFSASCVFLGLQQVYSGVCLQKRSTAMLASV